MFIFNDGTFRFFTAHYGSWKNDIRIVFRVRIDRDPQSRAAEKNINQYDRLLPASENEIQQWFQRKRCKMLSPTNEPVKVAIPGIVIDVCVHFTQEVVMTNETLSAVQTVKRKISELLNEHEDAWGLPIDSFEVLTQPFEV